MSEHATEPGRWAAVDDYITGLLIDDEPLLAVSIPPSADGSEPPGPVEPLAGKLLALIAQISGARSILDIGTLGGYSAIQLGRAVGRDGRVVTLEINPGYAEIARANIAAAGLAGTIEVRVGAAIQTLAELAAERAGPFDMVFIDADKPSYPGYLEGALALSRPGTVIVADNVVRGGKILDPDGFDARLGAGGIQGIQSFYELLAADDRVEATVIQTVSRKGHDGFALVRVIAHS